MIDNFYQFKVTINNIHGKNIRKKNTFLKINFAN